jgi:hypothetical protein
MYEKASLVGVYPSSAGSKAVVLGHGAAMAAIDTQPVKMPEASLPGGSRAA